MYTSPIYKIVPATAVVLSLCAGSLQAQDTYPVPDQTQVPGAGTQVVNMPPVTTIEYFDSTRTYIPRTRTTDAAQVNDNSSPEQVAISTSYTNGLGATIQTIQLNATKDANGAYRHLVAPNDTRTKPDPYSFMPYPSTIKNFNYTGTYESVGYHSSSRYPSEAGATEGVISTGQLKNTSTATERSMTAYAPGKSRMGQGRGTKTTAILNKVVAGQNMPGTNVRLWSLNASGLPVSSSIYAAGTLSGSLSQDADGMEKYVLSNRSGNPVYEATLLRIIPSIPAVKEYAETYYVYDKLGRLRYTLPPKAVAAISAAGWTVSQALIDELCFSYRYDAEGRQHSVHKPGEQGYTELVYRKDGQLIMRRSPLEQAKGLWELMFYDPSGRVTATGLLTNSNDRAYWQGQANAQTVQAGNSPFYYSWGAAKDQYPPKTGLAGTEMLSYTYYDEYPGTVLAAETYDPAPFQAYLQSGNTVDIPAERASVYGFQTAAEVKVLHNAGITTNLQDWTSSKSYYDYYGRTIYSVGQNATGAKDSLYRQYNVQGQPVAQLHLRNAVHNGSNSRTTESEVYAYEAYSGRLSGTWRSTNGALAEPAVRYTYDELGRMSKEVLGNDAETRLYTYNVRGELLGINEDYALSGNKTGEMTFGEALRYDHGFTTPRYNGLVAGTIWRGSGGTAVKAHSYTYTYDVAGRMTGAKYNEARYAGAVLPYWNTTTRDYSQTASYDLNGNILSATRWGVSQNPAYTGKFQVDRLNYTYFPNSNKLEKVNDAIVTDYHTGDYQPGTAQGYSYDVSGNLTEDKSKNISSVTYTWFNKPEKVSFGDGSSIYYTYDAGGSKLQEVVQAGGQNNTTNYISSGVYKNGTLSFISTGQGRTNMEPATPRQEYFVKDHLGNIRSTVASAVTGGVAPGPQSLAYTAGYEPADEAVEIALFDKVSELRADKPGNLGTADQKAALLQDNQRLGTSIMLKVMAGDKVDINAESFYESLQQGNSNTEAPAGQLFEQVIGSLAGGSGALNSAEGSSPNVLTERILSKPEAISAYEDLLAAETDSTRPKAFLNFLFFDEEMNLVPEHSRIWQADGESSWSRIGSEEYSSLEMPQNGYIVSYLSNQSEQEAWFDNMSVAVSPGILLEERHYYAYGLPIAGLGSQAATATKNRQRYQGNEYLEEQGLDWMDFHNRQYDPQLGRFLSIDPLADASGQQVLSPYHAMGCNPVSMVDPLGLNAGMFPGTQGAPGLSALDIALYQVPTMQLDKIYGGDPWSKMNRGALNAHEAQLAGRQRVAEAVSGLLAVRRYKYYLGLEKQRDANTDFAPTNQTDENGLTSYRFGLFKFSLETASEEIGYRTGNFKNGIKVRIVSLLNNNKYINSSKYKNLNWVQSTFTDAPINGKEANKWELDGSPTEPSPPFYWGPKWNATRKSLDSKFGGSYFSDFPGRTNIDHYWFAQLSLVGQINGVYENIMTIKYGYSYRDGQFRTYGPYIGVPTSEQNGFINQANENQ